MHQNLFSETGLPPPNVFSDHSFNRGTLSRCFTPRDFYLDNRLADDTYRANVVSSAIEIAKKSDVFTPNIKLATAGGKTTYTVSDLAAKLVLRKCTENVKESAQIRIKPRSQTISELITYLKEGTNYRIYRLDIKSFFESCDSQELQSRLKPYNLTRQTLLLLESFLDYFNSNYTAGLPRGIEISPMLAETALLNFDSFVRAQAECFYYSRFVDDIILITSSCENPEGFKKQLLKALPKGLRFNYQKTQRTDVADRSSDVPPKVVACIDYLGYQIQVIDCDLTNISGKVKVNKRSKYRKVTVDLSEKKISQFKTRISKAFYVYSKDLDFKLLKDRIEFLATNRNLVNKRAKRKILTGIYYNYSSIDSPSKGLNKIDSYLAALIKVPSGRLGAKISGKLSKSQKAKLLKIGFEHGHSSRVFKRFSPSRLSKISSIWK